MTSEDQHRTTGGRNGWLIEWDGGWDTADSPEASEAFIGRRLAEWGDGDRAEFAIVRNEPTDHRVEVWQRGERIAVSRDGLPVGEVTRVDDTFAARIYCVPAPFDRSGGVHGSVESAVDFVAENGETPDHMRAARR